LSAKRNWRFFFENRLLNEDGAPWLYSAIPATAARRLN
jgi:hypothetical protein